MSGLIVPVILSGGAGQRLWPLSTSAAPKQFHALGAERTMIQETTLRFAGDPAYASPVVICGEAHEALVREQLAAVDVSEPLLILEPFGRNTAAAAAAAARVAAARFPGALILLLPADHRVGDAAGFRSVVARAAPVAARRIVTFGIDPSGPATGYGYIKAGEALADGVFAVERFVEKPDRPTAERYLAEGGYSWNAGVFLFDPAIMLEELRRFAPAVLEGVDQALRRADEPVIRLAAEAFAACPSEPLDTAVMERTALAAVAPCDIGWADIGAWGELLRLEAGPDDGNALHGAVAAIDVEGSLVWSTGPRVGVVGLKDVIVVATPDGVLVAAKDRDQDVKALLAELNRRAG